MLEVFCIDYEVSAWCPTYTAELGFIKTDFRKVVVVCELVYISV